MEILLEAGINPNIEDILGRTPLEWAVSGRSFVLDRLSKQSSPNVDVLGELFHSLFSSEIVVSSNKDKLKPIHVAALLGNTSALQEAIDDDEEMSESDWSEAECVNSQMVWGISPLCLSALSGSRYLFPPSKEIETSQRANISEMPLFF